MEFGRIRANGLSVSTVRPVRSRNAASKPATLAPPPDRMTRSIRLSAVVAAKKSSDRLISPMTVSVTLCIASSTSAGTTAWSPSESDSPNLIRSASSKLIERAFWISSVY